VTRAAALLASKTRQRLGASLTLVKRIPVAAGLGGGSTDAAATLLALNGLWQTRLRLARLEELAAELGSDVPFFVRGGAALMLGRGEALRQLPPIAGQWLILVVPPHTVTDKTRRLYAALESGDFSPGETTSAAVKRLEHGDILGRVPLVNGFERAARRIFPELSTVWDAAERQSGRRFHLSGAGPAIFALASDRSDARQQVARLAQCDTAATYAVRTVRRARAVVSLARRG
jgi:4-diphosphocytidyl-2-C-methyl-D-erythritol kinase